MRTLSKNALRGQKYIEIIAMLSAKIIIIIISSSSSSINNYLLE